MIEVQHLSKTYNSTTAVSDVSFIVQKGQTLVLLGTSGSGKTTTLRMINRLVEPTSGSVIVDGKNILYQPPEILRRGIGYVLQGYGLFPHYTVAENIAVVPKLLGWPAEKIKKRVAELLQKLHLPPQQYLHVYPAQLSGGQMQRVGLARALAADPPILLMDEPFGALDPLTRKDIRKEFRELDELKRKTIILVTHDVQEAFELGDLIGLMDKGKLLQIAPPTQLLFHPSSAFVTEFFTHHRLQLEWQAISLIDIWNDMPESTGEASQVLNSSSSVWETMEALTSDGMNAIAYDQETATFRQITFAHLQAAIRKLKQPT
jgi:osmoprotectant transport system ATP-binding protein